MSVLLTISPAAEQLAQFGLAGLMGAMWLWERRTSQKREQQIDEAHTRILGDRVQLEQLIALVRENTEAMQRLASAQEQLLRALPPRPAV
jgi:hypothetical protein